MQRTCVILSKFGLADDHTDDDVETALAEITTIHAEFGIARLRLGALLFAVKNKSLWRGKASTFNEFLESENIRYSAANQYMKVAQKLIIELQLNDHLLSIASRISMTTLLKVCSKITRANALDMVHYLDGLSDRDAKQALDEFESRLEPLNAKREISHKVKRMVNDFYKLPNDLRIEFLEAMRMSGSSRSEKHEVEG